VVTDSERATLHKQIERVVPAEYRTQLAEARRVHVAQVREAERKRQEEQDARDHQMWKEEERRHNRASLAQLKYIADLGIPATGDISRDEASALIDQFLSTNGSITPRQWMVLRFWGKIPPPSGWGKTAVSEWMDNWYAENPDRRLAWELYKNETDDSNFTSNPAKVPVGIGEQYLIKVRNGAKRTRGMNSRASRDPAYDAIREKPGGCLYAIVIVAAIGALLFAASQIFKLAH